MTFKKQNPRKVSIPLTAEQVTLLRKSIRSRINKTQRINEEELSKLRDLSLYLANEFKNETND